MKPRIPPKLRDTIEQAWYLLLIILSILAIITLCVAGISHGMLKLMFYYKFVFGAP